jgi:poly-gamma-glutamate capsule biosynthesis protein CapA/YwtB (metallophosphatase superfamily)
VWSLLALALSVAPAPKSPVISVLFAGDVTLGFHHEEYFDEQVKKGKSPEEMFAYPFSKVRTIAEQADLFVVNLECPFTDRGEKVPKNFNFRARPEFVASLQAGSVDVVSLANNHLVDYGPGGLADTLATLDAQKIVHFGAGASLAAARQPAIVEVKGIKVAFLGYFFLGDKNIEPAEVIATESTPGVAGHHDDLPTLRGWVEADVKAARSKADLVIPFFHWGREGRTMPEPYQVELAHAAIDAGAAAVIGSHPHVLQGIEQYQGRPIVYSLGNFVFGGNWDPKDKRTAMVRMELDARGVRKTTVIPAYSDRFPELPIQPYPGEGDAGEAVMDHLGEISKAFKATLPELRTRREGRDGG